MNFLEYILNDIEEKKALLDVMPKNSYIRRRKYNDTVKETNEIYTAHKENIAKFILYKYEKLLPQKEEYDTTQIEERMKQLENVLLLGNQDTTYFEKMGFDILFYELMHYYKKSLTEVNLIIEKFLNIFDEVGVAYKDTDFKINIYSYAYMFYYLREYHKKEVKPNNAKFENIYWMGPKVIEYIVISLRMLIEENIKKFEKHVQKQYSSKLNELNFKEYEDVVNEYVKLKKELQTLNEEQESDITELCLKGELDINVFRKDGQVRQDDYNYFMIKPIDVNNEELESKLVESIRTLKCNLEEYNKYLETQGLIDYFKDKYKEEAINKDPKKKPSTALKDKQKDMEKIKKAAMKFAVNTFKKYDSIEDITSSRTKEELFIQEQSLEELYKAYQEYDEIYFDEKLKDLIKNNTVVEDIYKIVIYFPFFTKKIVKTIFEINEEQEIENKFKYLKDIYYNPDKKIIQMIPIYVEKNIPQQLMNGYRFENLNVTMDSFEETNLDIIFERSTRILRSKKVEKFKNSIDDINFLVNVKRLQEEEKI